MWVFWGEKKEVFGWDWDVDILVDVLGWGWYVDILVNIFGWGWYVDILVDVFGESGIVWGGKLYVELLFFEG